MDEQNNGKVKDRVISFRLSTQEYEMIEAIAGLDGKAPNAWARKKVLEETQQETGLSQKDRMLLEEIARLGYLIEHGFGIQLSANSTNDKEWVSRKKESKSVAARLVGMMLERRSSRAGME